MVSWRIVLTGALLAGPVAAQTAADRAGVERAVLDYVEGFYEGDTLKLKRGVQPDVVKLTAWWGTDYLLLAKYEGRWMVRQVMWQTPKR